MSTRLRFFLLFLGALAVIATYTFPYWQPLLEREANVEGFPGLPDELQEAYQNLPASQRRLYLQMLRNDNQIMALSVLQAALSPDQVVPEELQILPPVDTARIVAEGEFAPLDMEELELDNEDELSPYMPLFGARGTVRVYQYPDNRRLLRFEDFRVVNGSGLRVYLSTNPTPITSSDFGRSFLDLGPLIGNVGNQNYDVPREIAIEDYHSVIIYNPSWNLIYAIAELE